MWGTLQHIMQEPQARPGTNGGAAMVCGSCPA
jgi:hypothetical protein